MQRVVYNKVCSMYQKARTTKKTASSATAKAMSHTSTTGSLSATAMTSLYQKCLQKRQIYLLDNLDLDGDLLDHLFQEDVINFDNREKVQAKATRKDQAKELLKFLHLRVLEGKTFAVFLEALNKTHQGRIARELETELKGLKKSAVAEISVQPSSSRPSSSQPTPPQSRKGTPDLGALTLADNRPRLIRSEKGNRLVTISGLVVIGDCVLATGFNKPHLWIYDTRSHREEVRPIKDMQAVGMALLHGELVITDQAKKLRFITFDKREMKVTQRSQIELNFNPRRITVTSSGDLVIADIAGNIVICDCNGKEKKKIKVDTKVGALWCAVATAGKWYAVLDSDFRGKGYLYWVDESGKVIDTYKGEKDLKGPGQDLKAPYHIIGISNTQLLLADKGNDRVHVIGDSRKFEHYLLSKEDKIKWPACLYWDQDSSRLFVAHSTPDDKVEILEYNCQLSTKV